MEDDEKLTAEQRRKQNIADNRRILAEIGLSNPFKEELKLTLKKTQLKRKAEHQLYRPKKRSIFEDDNVNRGSIRGQRRRSARLQGSAPSSEGLPMDFDDEDEEESKEKFRPVERNRPNFYGPIPGVEVGASWLTRMECSRDGVHRPTVAGIHGGQDGAYSIALSGGYDDNIDYGECFTYTGEGGRDLKGTASNPKNLRMAPQSKNQTLTRGNLALHTSVETGNPVRVIRGYKLNTVFAPEEGYRYDGLYVVKKAWYTTGVSGFKVWKFALRRLPNQDQPPWEFTSEINERPMKPNDEMDGDDNDDGSEVNENKTDEKLDNSENDEKENIPDQLNLKGDYNKIRAVDKSEEKNVVKNECIDHKEVKETSDEKSHTDIMNSVRSIEMEKVDSELKEEGNSLKEEEKELDEEANKIKGEENELIDKEKLVEEEYKSSEVENKLKEEENNNEAILNDKAKLTNHNETSEELAKLANK